MADPAAVDGAWRTWREEVAFAEQFVAGTPDLAIRSPMQNGTTVALREVILHVVEEYARHLGHADLLRERIVARHSLGVPNVAPDGHGRPDEVDRNPWAMFTLTLSCSP